MTFFAGRLTRGANTQTLDMDKSHVHVTHSANQIIQNCLQYNLTKKIVVNTLWNNTSKSFQMFHDLLYVPPLHFCSVLEKFQDFQKMDVSKNTGGKRKPPCSFIQFS